MWPYFNLVSGMAKNCLTVGATQNDVNSPDLAGFSGRGPTTDGRIKPDVCAPGQGVRSARSSAASTTGNCDTIQSQGTSMATS